MQTDVESPQHEHAGVQTAMEARDGGWSSDSDSDVRRGRRVQKTERKVAASETEDEGGGG